MLALIMTIYDVFKMITIIFTHFSPVKNQSKLPQIIIFDIQWWPHDCQNVLWAHHTCHLCQTMLFTKCPAPFKSKTSRDMIYIQYYTGYLHPWKIIEFYCSCSRPWIVIEFQKNTWGFIKKLWNFNYK